ncbi:penicillin acylase family protein, partial [Streptomyces toyocaensis]|uniref:penicillin acylase family protein n=1 Tax=Streptomyces toyocaensis TaxID=55952 RepID=UPI00341034D9
MTGEIFRDPWGIPHLRADSANELARTQGRVTALDRAWQLEVERHRAQGTSASFLGPEALSWDRFARRARLADTARRCFAELERRDPETAAWVRAYVAGVNEELTSLRASGARAGSWTDASAGDPAGGGNGSAGPGGPGGDGAGEEPASGPGAGGPGRGRAGAAGGRGRVWGGGGGGRGRRAPA